MVKVHLRVNIDNAACQIISAFGDQMRICDNAARKNILLAFRTNTPQYLHDDIEERKATRRALKAKPTFFEPKRWQETYQKKPGGRIRK